MSMQLTKPASALKVRKSSRPKLSRKLLPQSPEDNIAPVREKLLEASAGAPPPPINLDIGKCHAMGDPTLQRNRHLCVGCRDRCMYQWFPQYLRQGVEAETC